jgi:hypothetical protein
MTAPGFRLDISLKLPELETPKPDKDHQNLYTYLGDKEKRIRMYILSKKFSEYISYTIS